MTGSATQVVAADYEPYLGAIREARIDLPRCEASGHWVWPPSDRCPSCGSGDVAWTAVPEAVGTIFSFIVVHHTTLPEFVSRVPYVLLIVAVADTGIRIVGTLTDDVGTFGSEDLIGRAVVAGFAEAEGVPVITWTLAAPAGAPSSNAAGDGT